MGRDYPVGGVTYRRVAYVPCDSHLDRNKRSPFGDPGGSPSDQGRYSGAVALLVVKGIATNNRMSPNYLSSQLVVSVTNPIVDDIDPDAGPVRLVRVFAVEGKVPLVDPIELPFVTDDLRGHVRCPTSPPNRGPANLARRRVTPWPISPTRICLR